MTKTVVLAVSLLGLCLFPITAGGTDPAVPSDKIEPTVLSVNVLESDGAVKLSNDVVEFRVVALDRQGPPYQVEPHGSGSIEPYPLCPPRKIHVEVDVADLGEFIDVHVSFHNRNTWCPQGWHGDLEAIHYYPDGKVTFFMKWEDQTLPPDGGFGAFFLMEKPDESGTHVYEGRAIPRYSGKESDSIDID